MLDNMAFNLYLVRHGESEVNVQPDIMGQGPEVKLTQEGKAQAARLGHYIRKWNFDYIYCSPYKRAWDTAFIALGGATPHMVPELREYDPGSWSACNRSSILTDDVKLRMGYQNMGFRPPNGESMNMVERRVSQWLEDEILYNKSKLDYLYGLDKPMEIIVFSHGMTIKSLLHYVMGFDKSFTWKIEIDNTSITKLSYGDKGWRLHYINSTAHLH